MKTVSLDSYALALVQILKLAITGKYPILHKLYFFFGIYSILQTVYLVKVFRVNSCLPVVYEFNN